MNERISWSQGVRPIREFGFKIPVLARSDGEVVFGRILSQEADLIDEATASLGR